MRKHRGFSLIELMIAVTLGMLAVAAVGSVFIYGSRNYKQDDKVSRMQDELRFAMSVLSSDLEMAGFFAQVRDLVQDLDIHGSATIGNDCGPTTDGGGASAANSWIYRERRASVFTQGNAAEGAADDAFPCISDAEFVGNTDIIAIKRLGETVANETGHTNHVHMRTNGIDHTIYRYTGASVQPLGTLCPAANCTITVYEYRPSIWYIRKYAVTGQDPPIPSLCRKYLEAGNPPQMTTECLAQGVQDMQLEFGLDSATAPDGVADLFSEIGTMPTDPIERANLMSRVVAVRVHLLGRSSETDVGYKNLKTFTLAGKTVAAANDGYYRKTQSSVVLMRNPANRLTPFALPQ